MILKESSRKVTTIKNLPIAGRYLQITQSSTSVQIRFNFSDLNFPHRPVTKGSRSGSRNQYARFHRVRQRIQPILNLAGLLTDGVKRAGIIGRIGPTRPIKAILATQVVARRATYLSHDRCSCKFQENGFKNEVNQAGLKGAQRDTMAGLNGWNLSNADRRQDHEHEHENGMQMKRRGGGRVKQDGEGRKDTLSRVEIPNPA